METTRTLRVQVPNNHILAQNQYYNYYYPKPKYLVIGYMDSLGNWVIKTQVHRVSCLGSASVALRPG